MDLLWIVLFVAMVAAVGGLLEVCDRLSDARPAVRGWRAQTHHVWHVLARRRGHARAVRLPRDRVVPRRGVL